jgi:hypothetical protein
LISRRQEHVIVCDGQPAALFEVLVEGFRRRRVQRNQAAFAELGPSDLQDAIGQYIIEPEIERFGNTKPGRGNERQQRPIDLPSKRVRPAKLSSRDNELHNLLRRVDVGQASTHWGVKRVGWHFVGGILGVQETGKACDVS